MAGRVSVAAETNSAALSAQAMVTPKRNSVWVLGHHDRFLRGWMPVGMRCSVYSFVQYANTPFLRDMCPNKISAETLTHINLAFTLISSSFNIVEMTKGDSDLWKRTTALKRRNPTLKVFVSIGGWTFNDPPTQKIFSNMVESDANTKTFISSFLKGLNVDWEYPAADDRGGIAADTKSVTCMADLKKVFAGPKYGSTFTPPSSYWSLQHLDMPGLLKSADWVNVMTYDLHGTWDGEDHWVGPIVGAHTTNLTEIDEAFKLYWRVGVDPKQMIIGLGFYADAVSETIPRLPASTCESGGTRAFCCSADFNKERMTSEEAATGAARVYEWSAEFPVSCFFSATYTHKMMPGAVRDALGRICEPPRSLSTPKPPAHTWSRIRDSPASVAGASSTTLQNDAAHLQHIPPHVPLARDPRSSNTRSCLPETSSSAAPCFEGLDRCRIICGITSSTLIVRRWIQCDALGRGGRLITPRHLRIEHLRATRANAHPRQRVDIKAARLGGGHIDSPTLVVRGSPPHISSPYRRGRVTGSSSRSAGHRSSSGN
ncbi:glycoside hydrolase superfamily [Mycena olivaceomarginata]|nr:glycoside hydrolase superfamily [Mycena olivaceomarginata]